MAMTNSEKAEIIGDMLEWQISAAMAARDRMRPESPSWRFANGYIMWLVHFRNELMEHGGDVYLPEFKPGAPDG